MTDNDIERDLRTIDSALVEPLSLEARGVTAELECSKCGDLTETTVPRDEKDETQKTICWGCMTDHLREKNLL